MCTSGAFKWQGAVQNVCTHNFINVRAPSFLYSVLQFLGTPPLKRTHFQVLTPLAYTFPIVVYLSNFKVCKI